MRLSNKSTFSLICLLVLMTFVAIPLLAHQPSSGTFATNHDGKDNNNPQNEDPAETNHTHTGPVRVTAIELVDIKIGTASTVQGTRVKLVADADATTVAAAARDAAGQFQLKLTFNQDVYDDIQGDTAANPNAIADYDVIAALLSNLTKLDDHGISVVDVDAATDKTTTTNVDESKRIFTVTFQLNIARVNSIFADSTADPVKAEDPLGVSIALNADVVFSKTGIDSNFNDVLGRNNEKSSRISFTIVESSLAAPATLTAVAGNAQVVLTWTAVAGATGYEYSKDGGTTWVAVPNSTGSTTTYTVTGLTNGTAYNFQVRATGGEATDSQSATPVAPDTIKPRFTFTTNPAENTKLAAGAQVQFILTASESLGTGNNELVATDVKGTTNVASQSFIRVSNVQYVVTVTPTDLTQPIDLTIPADAVMDTADTPNGNAAQTLTFTPKDDTPPDVTITAVPETGNTGKVVFTFTFSEELGTEDGADFIADDIIRSTGVTLAGNPVMVNSKVYTVLVNPAAIGDTILTLKTGSVADDATPPNKLVGDRPHKYVAPGPGPVNPMDPTAPANIFKFSVPAQSYVILVRNKAATIGTTPPIGQSFKLLQDINGNRIIPDANIIEWAKMPNLAELFDRTAAGGGGALVLRKAAGDTAAPSVGTVGISEILWAIDASEDSRVLARASQWIEIHNLNTTAKNVLIYAQTGAQFTSNKVVVNTQAGDQIYGKLGDATATQMVVDAMTNYFNGSDRGTDGWDVPGSNGSSRTGVDFVSMMRQPKRNEFHLTRRHENKNDKPLDGLYNNAKGAENSLDGRASGSWVASTVRYERLATNKPASATTNVPTVYDFIGTPGRANTHTSATHITKDGRTDVKFNTVVFNEIANRNDTHKAYEWIELRNVSASEINLRNYLISIVTAVGTEKVLYQFPANDNAKIAGNHGVFLLVASDPRGNPDHPLAVGYNVDIDNEDQVVGSRKNPIRYKVADVAGVPGFGNGRNAGESVTTLPDNGKFVLILRRPDNHEGHRSGADGGKGVAERGDNADLDKVVDVAGWHDNLKKTNYSNLVSSTNLWPLHNFEALDFNRNQFNPETVHYRASLHSKGSHNDHRAAWQDAGYTGIGYKLQASDSKFHGGSPGHHGNVKGKAKDLDVIISEVMLYQGARGNLPQWIELYNTSKTHAVNLADNAGWRLVIENPDRAPIITINFKNKGNVKYIPPNSTVLIVSSSARDYGSDVLPRGTVFPNTRVLNAYTALRGEPFALASRTAPLLDPQAFNLRLMDGTTANGKPDGRYTGVIADEIGNLDGNPRTNDEPKDNDKVDFPMGMTQDGSRTSLIRIFDEGVARNGMGAVKPLGGTKGEGVDGMPGVDPKYSWVHAADTEDISRLFVRHTWYGDESDYGSPADRAGQTLPVNLSHFRPTLENGQVVIRWTTESELDNAGFNILRSDTRKGEYKQVNAQLIQGHGTTGERHTYKWVDASAKPGVVYYYQIEDVSFAGERQTLQTTKLKGLISAVGKATTTWGDIKEVQ